MHIKDAQLFRKILASAEEQFSAQANPANVIKYARYFKDGYDAWGVDAKAVHLVARGISDAHKSLSTQQIIELGLLLFAHGKHEMGSLAIHLIEKRLKDCGSADFEDLKRWFDFGVGNWAHADYLCSKVLPYFLIKKIVSFADFEPWLSSSSRWTRRAAPVSMIKIKKEHDPKALMAFIDPLMTDPERVVHQGTGWFLRELWKVHPKEVEDFLYSHRNTAARLIIQYATEKISKEERLRFRRDKK
jgi:3-methyladenine DNA glycosylase AlkD